MFVEHINHLNFGKKENKISYIINKKEKYNISVRVYEILLIFEIIL